MSDKADKKTYEVYKMEDCLTIWELLDRWVAIPKKEIERLINKGILPIYENVTSWYIEEGGIDKKYLERFELQNAIFFNLFYVKDDRRICTQINVNGSLEEEVLEYEFDFSPKQFWVLLSDVKELEQQNPDYINPNNVNPSKKPAKPAIKELQAENESLLKEIERLNATIEKYEDERKQYIAMSDNDKLDNFFKEYAIIGVIYEMYSQGKETEKIQDLLTKNYNLTYLQAGGLTKKDFTYQSDATMKKAITRAKQKFKE